MRKQLIRRYPVALLAAALITLGGCSSATPLSGSSDAGQTPSAGTAADADSAAAGQSGPADATATGTAAAGDAGTAAHSPAPNGSATDEGTSDETVTGLSAACTGVINTQVAIAGLFAGAVDGATLTEADVAKVFGTISPDVPDSLADDIATLHDAAEQAVGKSDVEVASILTGDEVTAARQALSDFVLGCSPQTS